MAGRPASKDFNNRRLPDWVLLRYHTGWICQIVKPRKWYPATYDTIHRKKATVLKHAQKASKWFDEKYAIRSSGAS